MKINFGDIEYYVNNEPGYYEIFTESGIGLKVGISVNIRSRLLQYRASRQSGLKLFTGGEIVKSEDIRNPNDVRSKSSILAKHLFFDTTIAPAKYNLRTQTDRNAFLLESCYINFTHTDTKATARQMELARENPVLFRYIGLVIVR